MNAKSTAELLALEYVRLHITADMEPDEIARMYLDAVAAFFKALT